MQEIVLNGKPTRVGKLLDGFNLKATPQSSNVSVFGVNAEKGELFVRFRNGSQYLYNPVDPETLHQALHAESIGKFISREIVKKFSSTKIAENLFTEIDDKKVF